MSLPKHYLDIAVHRSLKRPNTLHRVLAGTRQGAADIRREMRRRAAVEPVIGHLKDDHRMRRKYLKGRDRDRINAVLAAAGFKFSLLLRWLRRLFVRPIADPSSRRLGNPLRLKITPGNILHGRQ